MLFHNRITVPPGHSVLAYRGDHAQTLPAGRHRVRKPDATLSVDLRERLIPVAPQEVLTAEVRSAALDVITAKTRGLAKLEAARAETAALRALANAGRLLDAHPALAQLRLVESVPYGARVVLSVGGAEAPPEG